MNSIYSAVAWCMCVSIKLGQAAKSGVEKLCLIVCSVFALSEWCSHFIVLYVGVVFHGR